MSDAVPAEVLLGRLVPQWELMPQLRGFLGMAGRGKKGVGSALKDAGFGHQCRAGDREETRLLAAVLARSGYQAALVRIG